MHIDLHIIFPVNIRYGPLTLSCSCMQHCTQNREPKVGKHECGPEARRRSRLFCTHGEEATENQPEPEVDLRGVANFMSGGGGVRVFERERRRVERSRSREGGSESARLGRRRRRGTSAGSFQPRNSVHGINTWKWRVLAVNFRR